MRTKHRVLVKKPLGKRACNIVREIRVYIEINRRKIGCEVGGSG
jgi:hypothetical protein